MWSSYKPEEPEKILVASASIHGHTRSAAHILAEKLRAKGAKVVEMDLTRTGCLLRRHRSFPLRQDRSGLRHL